MIRYSLPIVFVFVLLLWGCTSSVQKLEFEIPPELQDNPEVVSLLTEMATTVDKTRSYSQQIIKITKGKDVENAEELTTMQTIKLARIGLQMMRAANDMEKYSIYADSLRQDLSPQQVLAFDTVREKLKITLGDADMEKMGISKEEMLALQKQQTSQKAEKDSIDNLRTEAIAQMEAENTDYIPSETTASNNSGDFNYWHLLIPIAVLSLFIYFILRVIKRLTSRFKAVRDYGFSGIKEDANKAFKEYDDLKQNDKHENQKVEIDEMREKFNSMFGNKN